jgi:hypothetical protein
MSKPCKSFPLWEVTVKQYKGTYCTRGFTVEVNAPTEQLAGEAAIAQINRWALGDFSVNVSNDDKNAQNVRTPFIRYGVLGARNRIVSIRRIG